MNNDNLLKGKATQFQSGEEAARNGQKGGLQLGINNAKRRAFKEYFESELDKSVEICGITVTAKEAMCIKLVRMMFENDINSRDYLKAFDFIRNTIGEQPVEKYAVSEVDPEVVAEVERLVNEYSYK